MPDASERVCEGRVCVVTGAGRGIGREYALLLAAHGARVVVNDLGGAVDGRGGDAGPAKLVVDEIAARGGEAVVSTDDVSSWDGADRIVRGALETFGRLDVVVNNAGILRDRMLPNMSEAEWDDVIRVHLKGTFAMSRHASAYWRDRVKAGERNDARIINTSSVSGLYANVGQTNYGAAKAGIAAFTQIAAQELGRYGVTVNSIAPVRYPDYRYAFPFGGSQPRRLIQGVDGKLTHQGLHRFAFDFEMPIGTPVLAARDGIVLRVADGFPAGAFEEKYRYRSNGVFVLHPDGTSVADLAAAEPQAEPEERSGNHRRPGET